MRFPYQVEVPHRIRADRYPHLNEVPPPDSTAPLVFWPVWQLRGCRFRLTVTKVDTDVRAMVEGVRLVSRSSVVVLDLTASQADEAGLPPGAYRIQGVVTDGQGHPVRMPELDTLRVPARWLYPAEVERLRTATATPATNHGEQHEHTLTSLPC